MVYKTTLKSYFSYLVFCLFFVGFGFGQSIFTNPITGTNPGASNPYTTGQIIDDNITVSGLVKGPEVGTTIATPNRYNTDSWNTNLFDPAAYFEFTITPNSGYEIDFLSFDYTGQRSETGPPTIEIRSNLDGYLSNIGTQLLDTPLVPISNTVDLTGSEFQNVTTSISFRVYAWGATHGNGSFSINDFTFNGVVSTLPCASTVTWNGAWIGGAPDYTTEVIIASDYNTDLEGNFESCSLTVNANSRLIVANGTFVEVINDVHVDGELYVETQGNFVQSSNYGTFNLGISGYAQVFKETAPKAKWYHYTYWSSPVIGQTIEESFPNADGNRRFWYNAANYLDVHTNGTTNGIPDNIDDNGNDWQYALGDFVMQPGVGYAATESQFHMSGGSGSVTFIGEFNTRDIPIHIHNNPLNTKGSWNLIGNPYASAIDFVTFQQANSGLIGGTAYFWSQTSPPSAANAGNQVLNFSQNDYAIYTIGSGGIVAGADDEMPNGYVASGQSFFIAGLATGNATFTNAMRMADATSNSQFFKDSNSKTSVEKNKLWVNLTSDNGVFSQVLTAYVDGATNEDDGLSYDAPRLLSKDYAATIYSNMDNSNQKFAIQGKDANSLDANEIINLGFSTNIKVATLYTLSIAQLQGDFLTNNTIYLKDNVLGKVHNLSDSDYPFTSEVGEFNDRFVVMFNNQSLSTDELLANTNTLKIIDLDNDQVQFTVSNNVLIKKVFIFDLLGRELYQFKGQNNSETYTITNLKNNIYIAKVELSNGTIITKKAVKK